MESTFSGSESVGIPILSIYGFLRFVTHPRHLQVPATFAEAARIVDDWLALPHVSILHPGDRHWIILEQLSQGVRLNGAQVTDAGIAAITMKYGATFYTN